MKKMIALISLIVLTITLSACDRETATEQDVFVTSYPMYYLVSEIGEGLVNTRYVPGSQVHGHSESWVARDIEDMQDAVLLFFIGAGFDPYIEANMSTFEGERVELVRMENYINIIDVHLIHDHDDDDHDDDDHDDDNHDDDDHDDHDDAQLMPDPHFWLDPERMLEAAHLVQEKLLNHFPEASEMINNNFVNVEKALEKLHEDFHSALSSSDKPIITNVKLFSYFENVYGIEIYPLSLNAHAHEDERIPSDFEAFITLAETYDIQYVLFEKNAVSPAGETLLEELRKVNPDTDKLYLHPLDMLTSDELAVNKNYINIMYDNLEALIKAID